MQPQPLIQTIPVLFKRAIDQKRQYNAGDLSFEVNLNQLTKKIKRNNDPRMVYVKTLHIHKRQLILSYQKKPLNRIMHIIGPQSFNSFLFLSFDMYKTQRQYAKSLLTSSIVINKQTYNFFGYSKSNLKQYSCYFYKATSEEIQKVFSQQAKFDEILQVSKKAARLSMLYCEARVAGRVQDEEITVKEDVVRGGVCFSDGCGLVSVDLARKIKRYLCEVEKQELDYLPAVYQIRVKGVKGVLVINLQTQSHVLPRHSMCKFQALPNKLNELILINHSKPSYYGAINQQIIMLLSSLGVEVEYFLQLQQRYLELLKKAVKDPIGHVELLRYLGEDQRVAEVLKSEKNKEVMVKAIITEQIYKNIRSKDMKNRLKIPLDNARFLYGVVYPELFINSTAKLEKRQIFLRVTTSPGVVQTIIGKVIVTKNPCYYPGDIRILQAIDIAEHIPFANKLVDVIIFSTEGKDISVGGTMAGSDYDGDQYFVCWDQGLIPEKEVRPYHYPSCKPKTQTNPVTQKQLIDYFVNFDRHIVARINARYLEFATYSQSGVQCPQCIQLGTELFSRAIDSVNTGERVMIPEHLTCFLIEESMDREHVWVEMQKEYERFLGEFELGDGVIENWRVSYKEMEQIVQSYIQRRQFDEYNLFNIIKSWYLSTKCINYNLFTYIDFTQLTVTQKHQTKQLPNFPQHLLGNPFQLSPTFTHPLFTSNGIFFHTFDKTPKNWRPYYTSQGDQINFGTFYEALSRFNNVLIGVHLNEHVRLVFSITQMKKRHFAENLIPDDSLRVYYAGYGQLKRFQQPNLEKKDYRLYYGDQLFQIYEGERRNSFFWLKDDLVSIDLTRFDRNMLRKHPKINKQPIKYFEVYVGLSQNYRQVQIKKLVVSKPIQNKKEEYKGYKYQEKRKYEYQQQKPKYQQKSEKKPKYVQKQALKSQTKKQQKMEKVLDDFLKKY